MKSPNSGLQMALHDLQLCNVGLTGAIRAMEQSARARQRLRDTLRTAQLDRRAVRILRWWLEGSVPPSA